MKKRIAILMVLTMIFTMMLAACGGGSKSSIAGTYKFESIDMDGFTMTADEFASLMGDEEADLQMNLILDKDGKFTMDIAGDATEGTWEYKEPTLTMTAEGESIEATYADGVITIEEDGMSMTFKK